MDKDNNVGKRRGRGGGETYASKTVVYDACFLEKAQKIIENSIRLDPRRCGTAAEILLHTFSQFEIGFSVGFAII